MKFSLKKYEKDRNKCYQMSKKGINLESLGKTEERISSQRIQTLSSCIYGSTEVQKLVAEAQNCKKKSVLELCELSVKDRKENKCQYCAINI